MGPYMLEKAVLILWKLRIEVLKLIVSLNKFSAIRQEWPQKARFHKLRKIAKTADT